MALIQCSECGGKVSDKAAACPHCGAPIMATQPQHQQSVAVAQPRGPAEQQQYAQPPPQPQASAKPQGPSHQYAQPQSVSQQHQPAPVQLTQPQPQPQQQWQAPVREVKPPTRAHGFVFLLVLVPVLLTALHGIALGSPGITPLVLVAIAGLFAGLYVASSSKLRVLGTGELLSRLFKNKIAAGITAAVVLGAEVVALAVAVPAALWRGNLDDVLASADPCAVEQVEFVHEPSDKQSAAFAAKKNECEAKRDSEARAERTKQCGAAAARAQQGKLDDEDLSLVDGAADLAKRIASGSLKEADFRSAEPKDLPCGDSGAGAQWWTAFTKAAARSSTAWGKIDPGGVSDKLVASLASTQLSAESKKALSDHVEKTSDEELKAATGTAALERSKGLCELSQKVGIKPPDVCSYLLSKYDVLRKREEASAEAKRKADDAKAKAEAARAAAKARADEAGERAEEAKANAKTLQCLAVSDRCDQVCGRYHGDMRDRCEMECIRRLQSMGCN